MVTTSLVKISRMLSVKVTKTVALTEKKKMTKTISGGVTSRIRSVNQEENE